MSIFRAVRILNVNGVNLQQDSDDIFAKTIVSKTIDDSNLTQVIEYITPNL